jgi:glycine oxidase
MLAPVTELHYTEVSLLRLGLLSLQRYPAFVAELEDAAGADVGYAECGTVDVAWDAADLDGLRDLHAFATELGLACELVGPRELRGLEPALAPGLPGGLHVADDRQVDPRRLHSALRIAAERAGVRFVRDSATVTRSPGVALSDGTRIAAERVVLAAGAWSARTGVPPELVPVRPVRGQTVRLRTEAPPITRVVRGRVKGIPVYLVPRADGELVVGASSEEAGYDLRPRTGPVYELLRDAQSLVPELGEAEFIGVSTGLRPGSPDNAPIIGALSTAEWDHVVVAAGHHRNGILLTPVTADGVAELVATGRLPAELEAFGPDRFRPADRPTNHAEERVEA